MMVGIRQTKETECSLEKLIQDMADTAKTHMEERKKLQENTRDFGEKILVESAKTRNNLLDRKTKLQQRERELEHCEAEDELKRKKLLREEEMIDKAILVQMKADESLVKLVEKQKREKEEHLHKIIKLEKRLAAKHILELEMERMRGASKMIKCMGDHADTSTKNQ